MQPHKVKVFKMECETSPSGCPISSSLAASCSVMTYMCVHVFASFAEKKGLAVGGNLRMQSCWSWLLPSGPQSVQPSVRVLWVLQYLDVYCNFLLQETTAKEVVMLALQEFGVTDDSR